MNLDEIRKHADEAFEKALADAYPDPNRRKVARLIRLAANKALVHRLVTGRDPTDEELRSFLGF